MPGFRHDVKRYLEWSINEWTSIVLTAAVGGLVFGFLSPQEGVEFAIGTAAYDFIINFVICFGLLTMMVWAMKTAGVFYGIKATYDKYALGLVVGVFIGVLTFGFIPFFITGRVDYKAIPNLRIGKYRATMAKNWEITLASAAGPLLLILTTIPANILYYATGLELFRQIIIVAVLLAVFTMLPLPLIQTANPYSVYMSRVEALESNVPGFDIFFGSRSFYFFLFGMIACFALLALLFSPSALTLLFSFVLGIATMFIYMKVRYSFA